MSNVIVPSDGFLVAGCRLDADRNCATALLLRSVDGVSWTVSDIGAYAAFGVPELTRAGDRLFAVGYAAYPKPAYAAGTVIWTSRGGPWSAVSSPSFRDRAIQQVVASPIGAIAVGIEAPNDSDNTGGFLVWPVRSDGTFGTVRIVKTRESRVLIDGAIWTGREFLAWGRRGRQDGGSASVVFASPDGKTWAARGTIPSSSEPYINDIVTLGNRRVAVGYVGSRYPLKPAAWFSLDDGGHWTRAVVDGADGRMVEIEPVEGGLVAFGDASPDSGGRLLSWSSADGSTWRLLPDDQALPAVPGFRAFARAVVGDRVCVAGTTWRDESARGAIYCRSLP